MSFDARTDMLQAVLDALSRDRLIHALGARRFDNAHLTPADWCHHATLYHPMHADGPEPFGPDDVGRRIVLVPSARVVTDEADAMLVFFTMPHTGIRHFHQAGRRFLHVTIGCAPGLRPQVANDALRTGHVQPIAGIPDLAACIVAIPVDRAKRE